MFAYFRGLPRITGPRSLALWLTLVFIFAVPWENAIHVAGIGRISKTLGIAAFGIWVLSVVTRGRLRRPDAFQRVFFLFLIWNGLTLYWSLDSSATLTGFATYSELFGLLLMLWDLCESETVVNAGLQAYVLGAFITGGSVIVNFLTAPQEQFPQHQRISALGFQTDGIALVLAIAAPAAWYLASGPGGQERPVAARVLNYGYMPVGVLGLAMTGTRGAALASIPSLIFVVWTLRHARGSRRMIAVGTIVAAIAIAVEFAPRGPLDRIATATTAAEVDEGALSGRWEIWTESVRLLLERPLTGVGLDAHRAAVAPGLADRSAFRKAEKEAHNTYVSVAVETGVVGFAFFVALLLSVAVRIRTRSGWAAWYWPAQLGVLAIGAMSLSLEDSKSVWIFLSLAVASAAAARGRPAPEAHRPQSVALEPLETTPSWAR